jgi:hypothetical protein
VGYQEQLLEQASALGGDVAQALEPARQWQARAEQLNRQLDAARKAEEAEYAQHIEATVSTGKLPSPNGFGTWTFDSPTSKLVVASVAQCHQRAGAAVRDAAPVIFKALVARAAGCVSESVRLTKGLPAEVVDERSAIRAGRGSADHYAAWVRLGDLLEVFQACHELKNVLQRAGLIPGPSHAKDRLAARVYEAYEVPHRLATMPPGTPLQRRLAAAEAAGAGPGLIDWDTAVQRWERVDRRQKDYVSMSVVQAYDSRGGLVAEERSPEMASGYAPAAS